MHSRWPLATMSLSSLRMHLGWERASYLPALLFVSCCLPFLSARPLPLLLCHRPWIRVTGWGNSYTAGPDPASKAKFGFPEECWDREMTWGDAQGSGKRLLGVEMWCMAGKSFWGLRLVFLPEMWLPSWLSTWACADSCWRWGILIEEC